VIKGTKRKEKATKERLGSLSITYFSFSLVLFSDCWAFHTEREQKIKELFFKNKIKRTKKGHG
jgi:hypothetical protein